ncbi:MAG: hypothetical protein WCL00_05925, partial [Bacteroidota bacterium]
MDNFALSPFKLFLMLSLSLAIGTFPFILFLFFLFAFLLLSVYYWTLLLRVSPKAHPRVHVDQPGLSVVICARNEYANLKENL